MTGIRTKEISKVIIIFNWKNATLLFLLYKNKMNSINKEYIAKLEPFFNLAGSKKMKTWYTMKHNL